MIKAQPPGTVVAYAGTHIPEGWLVCDGSGKCIRDYPLLFDAIGSIWGDCNAKLDSFKLPDMRGMFLRGYSGTSGNDPDAIKRIPQHYGGAAGNNVGTVQYDTLKNHKHNLNNLAGNYQYTGGPAGHGRARGDIQFGLNNETGYTPDGGSETRPKNVSVLYIIKYRN